jgi:hypothetical protein
MATELPTRFRLPSRFVLLFGDWFLSLFWSCAALMAGFVMLWWQILALGAPLVGGGGAVLKKNK